MTIFLLLGIILYFGLVLIYTFNAILISGMIYILMIPISFIHYRNLIKKFKNIDDSEIEDHQDIL